jgi:predicted dehydrogenase
MAAGASEESGFEIYGSQGALFYSESKPNSIRYYSMQKKQWLSGPGDVPPFADERPIEKIWPTSKYSQGMMTNAHLAAEYDLLLNIIENKFSQNDFRSASKIQRVVEAAYRSAERDGESYKLE